MSAEEKICVICGEDCSLQKRVKDKQGRYYHKECLDRAKAERKAAPAAEEAGVAPPEEPDPYTLDGGSPNPTAPVIVDRKAVGGGEEADPYALDSGAGPKTDVADVDAGPMKPCPHCHQPMPDAAMVCAKCGFNVSTGQRPAVTSFAEMAAARVGDLSGGKYWPKVIGITSIVAGAGGLIAYGVQLITTLQRHGAAGIWPISMIVATSLGAALGLVLIPAGIGVMRRNQVFAVRLQRWAVAKIVTCIVVIGGAVGAAAFFDEIAAGIDETFGTSAATGGVGALAGPALALLGWLILWPIVILFWFGREKVQKHLNEW